MNALVVRFIHHQLTLKIIASLAIVIDGLSAVEYTGSFSLPWKSKRPPMQPPKKKRIVDIVIFTGMAVNAIVILLILYYFVL